jgi:hypothetical protein
MRQLIALTVLVTALAAAGSASAGGWATVGVEPYPSGVAPGDTWRTEITVLQHGQTPLDGLSPVLTITDQGSGDSRHFTATPTGKSGVYEASVVFPEAGDWRVAVETGWWGEGSLTFGPVAIEDAPSGVVSTDSFPVAPISGVLLLLAALVLATFSIRRRWRPTAVGR